MFYLYAFDKRAWKRWQGLAGECQRRLTEQQIVPGDPGTILDDVRVLLQFVGPGGIVTKSHNATFPAERLPELNAKVGHPLKLGLKRALLRDYPNLAGLFILLRVMGLLEVKGNRLVLGPTALELWRSLNPTEQYFALLEALLFQAQSSALGGERNRREDRAIEAVPRFLGQLCDDRWRNFGLYESVSMLGPRGQIPVWSVFLQQQLGLITLRPRPSEEDERRDYGGRGWLVGGARLTPWGQAVTWGLLEFLKEGAEELEETEPDEAAPGSGTPLLGDFLGAQSPAETGPSGPAKDMDSDQEALESEEELDDSPPEAEFGMLQPVFGPYVPDWRTVYAPTRREPRMGTHILKVILAGWHSHSGGTWRRLAVPAETSLDGLAVAILRAFKLDDDHLYDFRYRDQRGKSRVYNHPYTDEGPFTPEITLAETDLALRDEMIFTFDYGDNWQFKVRLEAVDAEPRGLTRPKVIDSAGEAPEQYPSYE